MKQELKNLKIAIASNLILGLAMFLMLGKISKEVIGWVLIIIKEKIKQMKR